MPEKNLSKSEMVTAIETKHARLKGALDRFSDAQKTEPLLDNGWSIKDLMVHIAAWERVGFDIVQAALDGNPLKDYISKVFENIDNFNAQTYEKNKGKLLREVETEFQVTHQVFFDLIATLEEAFIASNLPFEGTEEITIESIISSNTYQHFSEHAEALEKCLDAWE